MEFVLEVRQYFGLSQASLATFLSVSVSLIKMVEQGKRELPAAAFLKLARLQPLMSRQQQPDEAIAVPGPAGAAQFVQKPLQKYITKCEAALQKNRQLLADMKGRQQEALHAMQLIDHLQQEKGTSEEARKDTLWVELLELETKKKWQQSGPEAEAFLQWRIGCCEHNMQLAQQLLASLKIEKI